MAIAALVIFVGAYALLVADRIHRTKVALGGAALMLLLHITDAEKAFFSLHTGVEWNVIFLLFGMMVIVSVLRQTGVFEYVAIWAAKRSRGRPYVLMILLVLLTAFASALLDNVTTVLLIAPVTFLVCDRLGLRTAPYIMAEVFASNIGAARHPDWYLNLEADPHVTVETADTTFAATATTARGADRDRLWAAAVERFPFLPDHQEKAGDREIPLVVLAPDA